MADKQGRMVGSWLGGDTVSERWGRKVVVQCFLSIGARSRGKGVRYELRRNLLI